MNAVPDGLTTFNHTFRAGAGPSERTLVLFHGTGGNENALLELGAAIAPDANLLGLRGRSREESQNRFFRRYAEGVFDEHDIQLQAEALNQFLKHAREHYMLTGEFTGLGYSNGANMVAATLLLHPHAFQSAILLRAMFPLEPATQPDLSGVRVLLLSGNNDPMAPEESSLALAEKLSTSGANVTHRLMPTGHQLSRADVEVSLAWLAESQ